MATGRRVAVIDCGVLAGLFGQSVEVRRSQVEGKKYPLYLSTPVGPVPLNTARAQNFILEHARFDGAPVPEAANDDRAAIPAADHVEVRADPGPAANDAPGMPGKKGGGSFFGWLGEFE